MTRRGPVKGAAVAAANGPHVTPATDDAGRELARILDGYIAAQIARGIALSGLADHLGDGPRTASELAAAAGAAADPVGRLLAGASLFGLVTQDDDGRFALTPVGAKLRSGVPGSLRDVAAGYFAPPIWAAWNALPEILATGQPPAAASVWEHFQQHPAHAAQFGGAMAATTAAVVAALDRAGYTPPPAGRIVDVGGGRGTLLAYLLRRAPDARGIVLDRPEALAPAPALFAAAGLADRAETAAGSFLDEVPGGDLHVLSNITHNWPDEPAARILANCHRASRPGGGLLLVDMLLPPGPQPSAATLMDLLMMVLLGGRERTLAQLRALAAAAGWTYARHLSLGDDVPWHAIEFRRE
jgi:SAM-dependent methyltransferase